MTLHEVNHMDCFLEPSNLYQMIKKKTHKNGIKPSNQKHAQGEKKTPSNSILESKLLDRL